jgi:hypothetical protein
MRTRKPAAEGHRPGALFPGGLIAADDVVGSLCTDGEKASVMCCPARGGPVGVWESEPMSESVVTLGIDLAAQPENTVRFPRFGGQSFYGARAFTWQRNSYSVGLT